MVLVILIASPMIDTSVDTRTDAVGSDADIERQFYCCLGSFDCRTRTFCVQYLKVVQQDFKRVARKLFITILFFTFHA